MRRAVLAAFAAAASLAFSAGPAAAPTLPEGTRYASSAERSFCDANWDTLGPITGDCRIVPLLGELYEDDAWGRWVCETMGNHICNVDGVLVIYFNIGGQLHGYELSDPHRPGCFVEPSNTAAGYEVIFYSRISGRGAPEFIGDPLGFEVNCPL